MVLTRLRGRLGPYGDSAEISLGTWRKRHTLFRMYLPETSCDPKLTATIEADTRTESRIQLERLWERDLEVDPHC
jgi:hypothetical protein